MRPLYPVPLGQRGFFDQFTVTFSRAALELSVDDAGAGYRPETGVS